MSSEAVQVGNLSGRYARGIWSGHSPSHGLVESIWPASFARPCPLPLHSINASFRSAL